MAGRPTDCISAGPRSSREPRPRERFQTHRFAGFRLRRNIRAPQDEDVIGEASILDAGGLVAVGADLFVASGAALAGTAASDAEVSFRPDPRRRISI